MKKHWNLNKTWCKSVGTILSLFLILTVTVTGCGGGSSGGSSGDGGGGNSSNEEPPEPFVPPEGILTKILNIDTASCPEVTVYFSVTDQENGEPIRSLTDQNFQAIEDGSSKVIKDWGELDNVSEPIVFSMVLDYSVSVTDQDLINVEDSATFFVDELFDLTDPLLNWGEITKFARNSEVIEPFTDDKTLILDAITAPYPARGTTGTQLYDAIGLEIEEMVTFIGATPGLPERSILIVVTDGENDSSVIYNQATVTEAAINAGIEIFAVGFGSEVELQPLFEIAIDTKGLYVYAPTSDDLGGVMQIILDHLQHQYWVLYDSSGSGAHTVEVVVNIDSLSDSDSLGFACP
jgi:hypothetical protein